MAGLARTLRRRQTESHAKPPSFFDNDIARCLFGTAEDGSPILLFEMRCGRDQVEVYYDRLREVTAARLALAGDIFALDVLGSRKPTGRLTTSLATSALPMLVASLDAFPAETLSLGMLGADEPREADFEVVELPLRLTKMSEEQIYGEPVCVGVGAFQTLTINVHNATRYVHSFRSEREALAQHERNVALDRPFAGAALN